MIKYTKIGLLVALAIGLGGIAIAASVDIPSGTPITPDIIAELINNIAVFLIFAGSVSAVIFLTWAGIAYVTAGADQTKVTAAKQMLKSGLIGSLIVFGVGTIIMTLRLIGNGDINAIFGS